MNDNPTSAIALPQDGLFSDSEWAEIFAALDISPRQQRIVKLMVRGMGDKQIVRALDMPYGTLREHVKRMFAHLGVTDRNQLVLRVVRAFRDGCGDCPRRRSR